MHLTLHPFAYAMIRQPLPCLLAAMLCALSLAGCQRPAQPSSSEPSPANAASTPASDSPSMSGGRYISPPTAATGSKDMDKACGSGIFRIIRNDTGSAQATTLQRIGPDGSAKNIVPPAEMGDYTAVGLACAPAATDGKSYLVVQYGELPFGCEFCEWFYLYDASGRQLTRSEPPLLDDSSLPAGKQQSANTREYESLIQTLGIEHPEVDYLR